MTYEGWIDPVDAAGGVYTLEQEREFLTMMGVRVGPYVDHVFDGCKVPESALPDLRHFAREGRFICGLWDENGNDVSLLDP